MPSLDIFADDAFTMTNLIAVIDKVPFVPGAAGKLGIFEESSTNTTTVEVEEVNGTLYLVPNTPRGGVMLHNTRDQRKVRLFKNLHLPVDDKIMADEIQNKRAIGSQTDLQIAEAEVERRLKKMTRALDATVEFGRISALQGVILDADGTTVIYNLFTEFGVTQVTYDFLLGTSTTDILSICENVRGTIQDELGADGHEEIEVVAFVGATFFQRLVTHPTVRQAYQYYKTVDQQMNPMQEDIRYRGFKYGGITFKVYRGSVGGVPFVPASQGTAFPTDVPNLYETVYSPADYMETANTEGRPRYAKLGPDPSGMNRFVVVETQTNPISLVKRPRVLVRLTTGN